MKATGVYVFLIQYLNKLLGKGEFHGSFILLLFYKKQHLNRTLASDCIWNMLPDNSACEDDNL